MYLLQDGRSEGCAEGHSIPGPVDPPNRVTVFMAGSQSMQQPSTTAALISDAMGARAGDPPPSPSDALSILVDTLTALAIAEVAQADKEQHDAEIAQVKSRIEQAKLDLAAEKARMATRQAELDSQAFRVRLDQNASQEVMYRRQRSRLPPVYEARNLFSMPGAGTSNQPEVDVYTRFYSCRLCWASKRRGL